MKNSHSTVSSSLPPAEKQGGGFHVSITTQHGQRYRYRASAISLRIKKGGLEMVENAGRTFLWFEDCLLTMHSARRTLIFHLKTGAASGTNRANLAILAELGPFGLEQKRMAHRKIITTNKNEINA